MGVLRIRKAVEDQSPEESSVCVQVSEEDSLNHDVLAEELKVDLRNPVAPQNEPDDLVKFERQDIKCEDLNIKKSSKGISCHIKVIGVLICLTNLGLFPKLPVASGVDEQGRLCSLNQYWDYERLTCLDICGVRGEVKCRVGFFCSARKLQRQIDPPQCMSWCSQECANDLYCDSETRKCLPCSNICNIHADDISLCRIHCLEIYNITQRSTTTTYFTTEKGPTDEQSSPSLTWATLSNSPVYKYATCMLAVFAAIAVLIIAFLLYLIHRRKKRASYQVNMGGSHKSNNPLLVSYTANTQQYTVHNNNKTPVHVKVTQV